MTAIGELLRSSRRRHFIDNSEIVGAVADGLGRPSATDSLSALCRFIADSKACKSTAVVFVWENSPRAVVHFGTDFDPSTIDWLSVIREACSAPAKQRRKASIELLPIETIISQIAAYFAFICEARAEVNSEPDMVGMDWVWSEVMSSAARTLALTNTQIEMNSRGYERVRPEIEFFPVTGDKYL